MDSCRKLLIPAQYWLAQLGGPVHCENLTRLTCPRKSPLAIVPGVTNWLGAAVMAERVQYSVEECYRRAEEARRLANTPGITPEEKADLLKVERSWLSVAHACKSGKATP
jgi:hypothetical protein